MRTTGNNANTPSPAKPGLFAALRGLLPGQGTSALSYDASPCRPVFLVALVTAVSALLIVSVAPALAATPPETPEVTVEAIAPTTATFNDVINPAVATFPVEAGTYQYLYRKTKTLGCEGEGKAPAAPVAYLGSAPFPAVEPVSGLTPDSYYSVCLHAETTGKAVATSTAVSFESAPEAPQTLAPDSVSATSAKLHGVLNPNAIAPSEPGTYEFLYRASATECQGESSTGPGTATGGEGQKVEAELPVGSPGEQYTVCLSMTNGAGETTVGKPVTFNALPVPPVVTPESTSATKVSGTSAVLDAEINPGGGETTYRFEYGTGSVSENHTAEATLNGADNNPHSGSILVQGLLPGREYHYRVVATNAAASGEGLEATFRTQAAGGEFKLPDDRAWEQVSPTDKYGSRIEAITKEGGVIQAAVDGSAFTYVAQAPIVAHPEGNPTISESQVLSTRGAAGVWSSRDIATPHEVASFVPPLGHYSEYVAFSPDLSRGVIERSNSKQSETPLSPEDKEPTLYLREGLREAGEPKYVPFFTDSEFVGASSNLKHIVFGNLDEWNEGTGTLDPVNILPDGANAEAAALGDDSRNVRNAVSEDGERVFWEREVSSNAQDLYVREGLGTPQPRTLQLNLLPGGKVATGPREARFQYATPDGTKVYFTDDQRLTPDSTAEPEEPELYEYDFDRPAGKRLIDLTPNPAGAGTPSMNVQGEVEISENGEYVYFVSNEALTKTSEHPGECTTCNLYVAHVEAENVATRLVAVLSGNDHYDWEEGAQSIHVLPQVTSRVSPNGHYLAFMSNRSLTGYDTVDASPSAEGARDEEVYVYDAVSGHIACASCDPTGERPHGVFDTRESGEGLGLLVDRPKIWKNRWLAGSVPGWTSFAVVLAQYQSRYLSDEGRLFFDAADGLLPQDTNGKEDVYEYEPAGLGPENAKCGSESNSGSEVYKPGSAVKVEGRTVEEGAGCVALISSGESAEESAFLDASGKGPGGEEGEDVFFLTSSKLSPQDLDAADDVYDAHVCSTAVPCAAGSAVSPPCSTTDSCRVAPAAQPAIFGASGSAAFAGEGNFAASTRPAVKPKSLTRAQQLAAALKACRKQPKKQRAGCQKQARKRYGATKPKRAKKAGNDRRAKR